MSWHYLRWKKARGFSQRKSCAAALTFQIIQLKFGVVESVLRAADHALPLRLVHASTGKSARAEPVAALYEAGRVRHAGMFAKLEDQLCGLMAGGEYRGPGRSPDRADALVWAMTELMLKRRAAPRVWQV